MNGIKNRLQKNYLRESIEEDRYRDIFKFLIRCEYVGPRKEIWINSGTSTNKKIKFHELSQKDIVEFLIGRLKRKSVSQNALDALMQGEGEAWHGNFRKAGAKESNKYRKVSSSVTEVAFCATAQLTRTSLEEFMVEFFDYCQLNGLRMSALIGLENDIENLIGDVRDGSFHQAVASKNNLHKVQYFNRLPSVSGEDNWLSAYSQNSIPFVGREFEKNCLDDFIQCQDNFKIWALSGPSGAGKTRLTVHWVNTSPALEGWGCYIVNPKDRISPDKWLEWSPAKNTLIIVDYIFGYDKVIESLVNRCQEQLTYFVRLLIIDHEIAVPIHEDKRWGFSGRGESLDFKKKLFFDSAALSLSEPQDQEHVIVQILSNLTKLHHAHPEIQEGKSYLRETQGAWQPLFAALVAEAINNNRHYSAWNRRDLIKYHLKGKSLPWESSDNVGWWASCFIAAATAKRGMYFSDLLTLPDPHKNISFPEDFDPVIEICRKIIPASTSTFLAPFEPDLLGESFFLLFLDKLRKTRKIQPIFFQLLLLENRKSTESEFSDFIGFIDRLTRNLLNEDQCHPDTTRMWQTVFDFLDPESFPKKHRLRLTINASLIEIVKKMRGLSPNEAVKYLDRVQMSDFFDVEPDALGNATAYSMQILELSGDLKDFTPDAEEILQLWIKNRDRQTGFNEKDPMFLAIIYDSLRAIELLISHDQRWLQTAFLGGMTPLMAACISDNKRLVRFFAEKTPDSIGTKDSRGLTALRWAEVCGCGEIVEILQQRSFPQEA